MPIIDTIGPTLKRNNAGADQLAVQLQQTATAEWRTLAYRADRFTASEGSWLVVENKVLVRYRKQGTSLWIDFDIRETTVTGTPAELRMALPEGLTAMWRKTAAVPARDNGGELTAIARVQDGGTYISFLTGLNNQLWAAATGDTEIAGQMVLEVRP